MKKKTATRHTGAITEADRQQDISESATMLKSLKSKEKKLKKKLARVQVLHGYVMTTDPEKWEEYNKNR